MLNAFKCPQCGKGIKTDLNVGQEITCPHCRGAFTLRPSHSLDTPQESFARILIPIGYVLFVAVPLVATIWYFSRPADRKKQEVVEREVEKKQPVQPPPVVPRPPRKDKGGTSDGIEDVNPKPKEVAIALAPWPHEVRVLDVAPRPREIIWRIPYSGYQSDWQAVGAVDLRITGLAVTKVPVIDPKGQVRDTDIPLLVIVMEARLNTPNRKRELLAWTYGQDRYFSVLLPGGKALDHMKLPLGSKAHTGWPLKQPLLADRTPVRDVLFCEVPPDNAGDLSLRLDGERCGEPRDVWFKIPDMAWKK